MRLPGDAGYCDPEPEPEPIRYEGITTGTQVGAKFLDPVPQETSNRLAQAGLTWRDGAVWATKAGRIALHAALAAGPEDFICVDLSPDF